MLHVRLGHDRAAQSAGTRFGGSAYTIRRCRSIQPIKYTAVVPGQAAAQTEGQRYRILLEVQPCFEFSSFIAIRAVIATAKIMPMGCIGNLADQEVIDTQKARDCTYKYPDGQLHGRQGRRSVLEDGLSQHAD